MMKFFKQVLFQILYKLSNPYGLKLQSRYSSRAGFTLVEAITAAFIFTIIVGIVVGIFVRSVQFQRNSFDAQKVVENSLFLLESISRDTRVSEMCLTPVLPVTATQSIFPTGEGGSTWNTVVGTATRWDAVDDPIGSPDDGATYMAQKNSSQNQDFTFPPFSISASSIQKVTVIFRGSRTAVGSNTARSRLRVNGSNYNGTTFTMTTAWTDYSYDWTTNPNTGSAWTEADIEGIGSSPLEYFSVEARSLSSGEEARVTQAYITVTYTTVGVQACSNNSLTLVHPLKGLITYSWDSVAGKMTKTEGNITVDISSSDINFTRFNFLTTGLGIDNRQPKVTMVISAQNRYGRAVKFDLQTSITSRNVEEEFQN